MDLELHFPNLLLLVFFCGLFLLLLLLLGFVTLTVLAGGLIRQLYTLQTLKLTFFFSIILFANFCKIFLFYFLGEIFDKFAGETTVW